MYLKLFFSWSKNVVFVNWLKWQVKDVYLYVSYCFLFQKVVCEVVDFFELNKDRFQELICGCYQLFFQIFFSFVKEYIKGDCDIYIYNEDGFLRIFM